MFHCTKAVIIKYRRCIKNQQITKTIYTQTPDITKESLANRQALHIKIIYFTHSEFKTLIKALKESSIYEFIKRGYEKTLKQKPEN